MERNALESAGGGVKPTPPLTSPTLIKTFRWADSRQS
jgi:hypothetical protein